MRSTGGREVTLACVISSIELQSLGFSTLICTNNSTKTCEKQRKQVAHSSSRRQPSTTTSPLRLMNRCIVLAVPEAVTRSILLGWLSLKDVARLDSAFCATKLRAAYQPVAFGQLMQYRMPPEAVYERSAEWLFARSVKVDGLWMYKTLVDDTTLRQNVLFLQSSNLRWITITEGVHDLEDTVSDVCALCPNLEQLIILAGSSITEKWDNWLPQLTTACQKLLRLELRNVACTSDGLARTLNSCVKLTTLKIDGISCTVPEDAALPSLECLQLRRCNVPDSAMIAIGARCKGLHTLLVFDGYINTMFPFTEVGVRAVLEGCRLLRETDVEYAEMISHEVRVELARRRNFSVINFEDWKDTNDALAQAVLAVSPALEMLRFGFWSWLTNATLAVCAQHCPLLSNFEMRQQRSVTAEGVLQLIKTGNKLRCVALTGNRQLGDEVPIAIAQHCPLLEVCYLAHLKVTDAAVVKLAEGCPRLKAVELSGTKVGDTGIIALVTHCPDLTNLWLGECPNVTSEGVRAVKQNISKLKSLAVSMRSRS
jgi:hypothetical protein